MSATEHELGLARVAGRNAARQGKRRRASTDDTVQALFRSAAGHSAVRQIHRAWTEAYDQETTSVESGVR